MDDLRLGDVAEVVDCEHKTAPAAEVGREYGYSVGTRSLRGGRIHFDTCKRVSRQTFDEWSQRAVLRQGDVILAREAPVGQVGYVDGRRPVCLGQRTVLLRPGERVDARFLHFLLLAPAAQSWMAGKSAGSTVAHLNVADIRRLPLDFVPNLDEQRRIAGVLGALDDLIAVNRALIEDLTEMKTATFQVVWEAMLAREHRVVPIGDLIEVQGGSTPSTKVPQFWASGELYWATPKDLSSLSSDPLRGTERRITEAGLAKISSGLLPAGTLLMSSRAPVGYLAIAEVPTAINQGFIATRGNEELPPVFLLEWLRANMDRVRGLANGSTFQEISKRNFKTLKLAVPTAQELARFMRIAEPCHRQIVALEDEIDELSRTRDALLPLLMSGRLRVGEVKV